MMRTALERFLDGTPPPWLRLFETAALMGAFGKALGIETPALEDVSPGEALVIYREFTAACMEIALEDERVASFCRTRLSEEARALGRKVRHAFPLRRAHAARLVKYLYRGIGIQLEGELPEAFCFGPCSFAQRYTPQDCWLMSAFDEGFICGIMGIEGTLRFDCRLTEGATCCRACLARKDA